MMELSNAENIAAQINTAIRDLPMPNTASMRAIRRQYSRKLRQAEPTFILTLAKELIETYNHRWLAYEFIRYHKSTFQQLDETKLEAFGQDMDSWDSVDAIARLLAGPAWLQGQIADDVIHRWAHSDDL